MTKKTLLLIVLLLSFFKLANAQRMTSPSYGIESDSVNAGGLLASSTSYSIEDTLGEAATGDSSSTAYQLRAGYQQMHEVYIAVSAPASVTLSPSLGGVTGGTSNGSAETLVTTDSAAGYELSIKASTSPAMVSSSNSIADFAPGGTPAFTMSVAASASAFAFSPEGTDIVQRFKDNGSTCDINTTDTSLSCWDGLSTANAVIASATAPNHPLGATTTLRFRVMVGSARSQPEGVYIATTTVTAVPL